MEASRLSHLLERLPSGRIGVVGDFCVDTYYVLDESRSEPSLETGKPTRPVRLQRSSLGAAGNVVANLHALGVGTLHAFALIGSDGTGRELLRLLEASGAQTRGVILQADGWQTHAYLKPMINGAECQRFDFGVFNEASETSIATLLEAIASALPSLDVLIINQQFAGTLHTPAFRTRLNQLLALHPSVTALADCRDLPAAYPTAWAKMNEREALAMAGGAGRGPLSESEAAALASKLHSRLGKPVFLTRGKSGALVADSRGVASIRGIHVIGKTDPVGAGDSFLAGVAAALAGGASAAEAASLGNLAAAVTVKKLHQTGTASRSEIWAIGQTPDYVYHPDIAEDVRHARYAAGTSIECVEPLPHPLHLRYAVFDHDGTISTLRSGWESVMEPMMIQAILGSAFSTVEASRLAAIAAEVRTFISQTTGIQTLQQMHGLAEMVSEAGYVPASEVLDAPGYKRIYNDALMALVAGRRAQLDRGELDVADFTVKNAVKLLEALRRAGVRLYLASGTDEADVIAEASALGYADLFEGRIYGASQDMAHEAKRMVLERILGEIGGASAEQIVTFGDGPVELRETRKRGGISVGVASDEERRFGLQPDKRSRLIKAGAHLIVPDYSQLPHLLRLLALSRNLPSQD